MKRGNLVLITMFLISILSMPRPASTYDGNGCNLTVTNPMYASGNVKSTTSVRCGPIVAQIACDRSPKAARTSPHGQQLAFVSRRDGDAEIAVMRLDGSGQRALTANSDQDSAPVWSPNGRQLLFRRQTPP